MYRIGSHCACIFSTSLIKIENEILPVENAPCETPPTAHHSEFSRETMNATGAPCRIQEDVISSGPASLSVPLHEEDEEIGKKDVDERQRLFQTFY